MISQLLSKSTTIATKGMVLIWSRYDYNCAYDDDNEVNNDSNVERIIIEPNQINKDKKYFSGRNLENIIKSLEYDPLALCCWVSRDLDKIVILKSQSTTKKKNLYLNHDEEPAPHNILNTSEEEKEGKKELNIKNDI